MKATDSPPEASAPVQTTLARAVDLGVLDGFHVVHIEPDLSFRPASELRCRACGGFVSGPVQEPPHTLAVLAVVAAAHVCSASGAGMDMLTITQAAARTGLTGAQIRRWCVAGQVSGAVLTGGRWILPLASLTDRLVQMEQLTELLVDAGGGQLWEKDHLRRVYFDGFESWAGIGAEKNPETRRITHTVGGEPVTELRLVVLKAFVDLVEQLFVLDHYQPIDTVPYTTADGTKHTLKLHQLLRAGFTAATGLRLGDPGPSKPVLRSGTAAPVLYPADKEPTS